MRASQRILGAVASVALSACATERPPPQPGAAPPQPTAPPVAPTATAVPSSTAKAEAPPPPPDEAPLLPGFVRLAPEGKTRCGDLEVQFIKEPRGSYEHFVRVSGPDGKRLYEAHGRRYKLGDTPAIMHMSGEFCGDLTGDGVPEIVLTESTVGAHCCYTHYVVSMTSPPKRLLMWEKGDAGTPVFPVQYREKGPYQLQGSVVMWPPFDVAKGEPALSYAGAPVVPVVFALIQGEYRLASLSFPAAYREGRDLTKAACRRTPDDCHGQLISWIGSLVIGDWDQEKKDPMYDDLRAALERPTPEMKRILASLGSEPRPVTPKPPR